MKIAGKAIYINCDSPLPSIIYMSRPPAILTSSRTGFSGFFHGSVLGQDTSKPQPGTGETQERHE